MSPPRSDPKTPGPLIIDSNAGKYLPYPADPEPARTKYEVYVGIRPEVRGTLPEAGEYQTDFGRDEHWAVILRAPQPCDPWEDCTWYHVIGSQWDEMDAYRRAETKDRAWLNTTFKRKQFVGSITEKQTLDFRKAFDMTPPQPSHFFVVRFLQNVVKRGLLLKPEISEVERMVGACPAGLEVDPEYTHSPVMPAGEEEHALQFEMEDI